jgi:hypothetical protein
LIWRVPVLLYLLYAGMRHLLDAQYNSLFGPITLVIHEAGHLVLSLVGNQWISIAVGSAAQLIAPLYVAVSFLRQREYFGTIVATAWLSFSLFNLATYIGDARAQQLPLIGFDANPIHDWNYLLSSVGLLAFDGVLAFCVKALAFALWMAAFGAGVLMCSATLRNSTPVGMLE